MSILNPELDALDHDLNEQFEREDAEMENVTPDDPSKRDLTVFPGFSGMGVMPRQIDGVLYEESLDEDESDEG